MSDGTYDVMIIGAGPAGVTAAMLLADKGKNVALVDREKFPREGEALGWLNAKSFELLKPFKLTPDTVGAIAFTDATFLSKDFAKSAVPKLESAPGYIVDRVTFANALVERAKEMDVTLIDGWGVTDLQTQENEVTAHFEDETMIVAKLLLLAAGGNRILLEKLNFPPPTRHARMWTAQVDASIDKDKANQEPHIAIVMGLDKAGSFALSCMLEDRMSVSINWLGEQEQAIPQLAYACRGLFTHEICPVDLSELATDTNVLPSPASAALDMDSHVGKHTLLIGDAGGFVSAASNEGLYPAMWSAQIATEVVLEALINPQSQDSLMTFESKWRMVMADYLRPPNTDVQFLLPLIFSNQPMADRMGAAFFSGENI